jgi:type VI secretion system protein VasD
VILKAGALLNPDPSGRSLPTVVRVLQLRNLIDLDKVEFLELWDHEKTRLAESFLSVHEVTLNPDSMEMLPIDAHPDARYLAAIALFRTPKSDSWRARVELPYVGERRCLEPESRKPDNGGPAELAPTVFFLDNFQIRSKS